MLPNNSLLKKSTISIDKLEDALADIPDDTELLVLELPQGIQIDLFYGSFEFEAGFYSMGEETVEITHVLQNSGCIPQIFTGNILNNINEKLIPDNGNIDVSGILYVPNDRFDAINIELAKSGRQTFAHKESLLQHIITHCEFVDELAFQPNWSYALSRLPHMEKYSRLLDVLTLLDFEESNRLICNTKTLENIRSFYLSQIEKNVSRYDVHDNEYSKCMKSIIIARGNIIRSNSYDISSQFITEISYIKEQKEIQIEDIQLQPDRYGRIRPTFVVDNIHKHDFEFRRFELPNIDVLRLKNYENGDIVRVKFITNSPILGDIITKSNREQQRHDVTKCMSCGSHTVKYKGDYCCNNVNCKKTRLYQLLFTCSKSCLDIPALHWDSLDYFVNENILSTLSSLLNVDRIKLHQYYDTDVVNLIKQRTKDIKRLLYRDNVDPIKKKQLIYNILKSLCLRGLYPINAKRLAQAFFQDGWSSISSLPLILSDYGFLKSVGIPYDDAQIIVLDSQRRMVEIDTLAREF